MNSSTFVMPQGIYDALKWITMIFLPAFGTFYYGFSALWDLPNTEKVVGTVVLVTALLGTLLKISSSQYNKVEEARVAEEAENAPEVVGTITSSGGVDPISGNPDVQLTFNRRPQEVLGKHSVLFEVTPPSTAVPDPEER